MANLWDQAKGVVQSGATKVTLMKENLPVQEIDQFRQKATDQLTSLKSQVTTYSPLLQGALSLEGRRELVESVTLESQIFPPMMMDRPFSKSPPAPTGIQKPGETGKPSQPVARKWGEIMKPRITVKVKGLEPFVLEPFGAPTKNIWLPYLIGVGATVGVLAALVIRGARRCKCASALTEK